MSEQPQIETVTTVGELDVVVVLLREFLHRSGALRAVAAVPPGPQSTGAVIDCERFAPIEVDLGDRIVQLAHETPLDAPIPQLPDVRQQPAFEVDSQDGSVTGAIGGIEHLAAAIRSIAAALGHDAVLVATFETTNAERPLSLSARSGREEPVVVTIGDDAFELG